MKQTIKETLTREITFTTERRHKPKSSIDISRKGSIVKEKCEQLSITALQLFPNRRISHKDLVDLIMRYIGGSKETIRSYLGYKGFVKHSTKGEISRVIGEKHKGYLEIFGFMHKKSGQKWFIHAQSQLISAAPSTPVNNEWLHSKENISFSPREEEEAERLGKHGNIRVNINNNNTEKKRNLSPMISPKISEEVSGS